MGNGAEMAGKVKPGAGRQGKRKKKQDFTKSGKIWTECHARGRGKTLSTIENPKVLTVFSVGTLGFSIVLSVGGGKIFSVGTLGFSIVLSVGGGKKINPTIYIYVRKGAAKFTRQGLTSEGITDCKMICKALTELMYIIPSGFSCFVGSM